MQANILKRDIMQRKIIYDGESEASVVSDIVLPESLGDIERILKCTFTPRLLSKTVEGSRLSLQGSGTLRMVYKTANGNLESFETQSPFSKNIDISGNAENMSINADVSCGFCSCRAVSERRFEMNAGVSIKAKVCAIKKETMPIGAENENVECKQKQVEAIMPVCFASECFTVMEEYELSGRALKTVVKTSAAPSVSEYKIISGKIILKGNVDFSVTYIAEDSDEPARVNYSIPVSHVLSCAGADEGDNVDVSLSICRVSAESSERGDRGELSVEILLRAEAEVSRKETLTPIIDAYCVGFESRCKHENIALTTLEKRLEKNHNTSIPIDTDGGEMLDAFVDIKNVSSRVNEQGEIMMSASALVTALCKNEEGDFFLNEKTAPIEFSLAASPELSFSELDYNLSVTSVTPNRNSVGLNLSAKCTATKKQSIPMVTEVEIMADALNRVNPKTALTIYFASKGEDTFDIAKRYNTSNREIMLQNSLSDTQIPDDMTILIPMKR